MYTFALNARRACFALAALMLCAGLAFAKPPLSAKVEGLIANQGVAAARERFAELWPTAAADYEPDVNNLTELGTRYLQEGNIEAAMAVMEMVSIISLTQLDTALQSQAALVAEMEAAAAEIAAEIAENPTADAAAANSAPDRGPAREDLDRLTGIYASDEAPERELFVTRTCSGFLVAGPLWADTASWGLRSEGETAFSFQQSGLQFQLEFATGADGSAQQLSHTIRGLNSPMQHRGPLPGDWPRCQPDPAD